MFQNKSIFFCKSLGHYIIVHSTPKLNGGSQDKSKLLLYCHDATIVLGSLVPAIERLPLPTMLTSFVSVFFVVRLQIK